MLNGEVIGLIAGGLTTASVIPQVIRVWRLKSAREISLLFNIMLLSGVLLWLTYGLVLNLFSVVLWNALTAIFVGVLLFLKLKFGVGNVGCSAG